MQKGRQEKSKEVEVSEQYYDPEVERKLKELMGKLQPDTSIPTKTKTVAKKHLIAYNHAQPSAPRIHKAKESLEQIKVLDKTLPVQEPQLPLAIKPAKPRIQVDGLRNRAAVVSAQSSRRPTNFKSTEMAYEKMRHASPKPQPAKQVVIEPLPSVFKKLPEPEQVLKKLNYKIKWFAPDSAFKNKQIDLEIGQVLGKGSFATVYEAYDETLQKSVAVKIFDKRFLKDKTKRKEVQDELDLVSGLDHPGVIKLLRVVEDQNKLYIVMDNWGKYNLDTYIQEGLLSPEDFKKVFLQVIDAVSYLHAHNVFHRDIKLSNIMIKNGRTCLLDFGLATCSNYVTEFLYCGTPTYMPPEMLTKKGYEGAQVDIWCIGVTLFKAITGKYPFGGKILIT